MSESSSSKGGGESDSKNSDSRYGTVEKRITRRTKLQTRESDSSKPPDNKKSKTEDTRNLRIPPPELPVTRSKAKSMSGKGSVVESTHQNDTKKSDEAEEAGKDSENTSSQNRTPIDDIDGSAGVTKYTEKISDNSSASNSPLHSSVSDSYQKKHRKVAPKKAFLERQNSQSPLLRNKQTARDFEQKNLQEEKERKGKSEQNQAHTENHDVTSKYVNVASVKDSEADASEIKTNNLLIDEESTNTDSLVTDDQTAKPQTPSVVKSSKEIETNLSEKAESPSNSGGDSSKKDDEDDSLVKFTGLEADTAGIQERREHRMKIQNYINRFLDSKAIRNQLEAAREQALQDVSQNPQMFHVFQREESMTESSVSDTEENMHPKSQFENDETEQSLHFVNQEVNEKQLLPSTSEDKMMNKKLKNDFKGTNVPDRGRSGTNTIQSEIDRLIENALISQNTPPSTASSTPGPSGLSNNADVETCKQTSTSTEKTDSTKSGSGFICMQTIIDKVVERDHSQISVKKTDFIERATSTESAKTEHISTISQPKNTETQMFDKRLHETKSDAAGPDPNNPLVALAVMAEQHGMMTQRIPVSQQMNRQGTAAPPQKIPSLPPPLIYCPPGQRPRGPTAQEFSPSLPQQGNQDGVRQALHEQMRVRMVANAAHGVPGDMRVRAPIYRPPVQAPMQNRFVSPRHPSETQSSAYSQGNMRMHPPHMQMSPRQHSHNAMHKYPSDGQPNPMMGFPVPHPDRGQSHTMHRFPSPERQQSPQREQHLPLRGISLKDRSPSAADALHSLASGSPKGHVQQSPVLRTSPSRPVVHQPKPSYPPGYAVGTDKTHLPASHPGFVPNPRGPHPPHPGFRGPHPGMYSQGQPMRPQDIPPRFEERTTPQRHHSEMAPGQPAQHAETTSASNEPLNLHRNPADGPLDLTTKKRPSPEPQSSPSGPGPKEDSPLDLSAKKLKTGHQFQEQYGHAVTRGHPPPQGPMPMRPMMPIPRYVQNVSPNPKVALDATPPRPQTPMFPGQRMPYQPPVPGEQIQPQNLGDSLPRPGAPWSPRQPRAMTSPNQEQRHQSPNQMINPKPVSQDLHNTPMNPNTSSEPGRNNMGPRMCVPAHLLIGDHSMKDILYMHCRVCGSTYGSVYGFRKHFRNNHGFEPTPCHVLIQSISQTKEYIHRQASGEGDPDESSKESPQEEQDFHSKGPVPEVEASKLPDLIQTTEVPSDAPLALTTTGDESKDDGSGAAGDGLVLSCQDCGENFQTREWMKFKRHVRTHEPQGERKHKCTYCDYSTDYSHHLQDHINKHTNNRPHVCKVCNIAYANAGTLSRHVRTAHTGDDNTQKLYLCHLCGDHYKSHYEYKQHLQYHDRGLIPLQLKYRENAYRDMGPRSSAEHSHSPLHSSPPHQEEQGERLPDESEMPILRASDIQEKFKNDVMVILSDDEDNSEAKRIKLDESPLRRSSNEANSRFEGGMGSKTDVQHHCIEREGNKQALNQEHISDSQEFRLEGKGTSVITEIKSEIPSLTDSDFGIKKGMCCETLGDMWKNSSGNLIRKLIAHHLKNPEESSEGDEEARSKYLSADGRDEVTAQNVQQKNDNIEDLSLNKPQNNDEKLHPQIPHKQGLSTEEYQEGVRNATSLDVQKDFVRPAYVEQCLKEEMPAYVKRDKDGMEKSSPSVSPPIENTKMDSSVLEANAEAFYHESNVECKTEDSNEQISKETSTQGVLPTDDESEGQKKDVEKTRDMSSFAKTKDQLPSPSQVEAKKSVPLKDNITKESRDDVSENCDHSEITSVNSITDDLNIVPEPDQLKEDRNDVPIQTVEDNMHQSEADATAEDDGKPTTQQTELIEDPAVPQPVT